jgi:hypothetical protein
VVQIRADGITPFRYDILLPARPVTLSIQSGSGAPLYARQDDGTRLAIAHSAPTFQFRAGSGAKEMSFTLAECEVAFNGSSTRDRADGASSQLPLASCGHDIVEPLLVDRIGFGVQTREGVAAGLLDGGIQFLDLPNSEIPLYH